MTQADNQPYASSLQNADTVAMTDDVQRAIEIGENALTDAHAHAPLPEVADWHALAEIVVRALLRDGWLLAEGLTAEHVWDGEPEDGHLPDCPGCALEGRIRAALTDGSIAVENPTDDGGLEEHGRR